MDNRAFYYEDSEEPMDDMMANYLEDEENESSLDFYDAESSSYSSISMDNFDITSTCIRPTLEDALYHFLIPILFANIVARVLVFLVDLLFGRLLQQLQSPSSTTAIHRFVVFLLLNLQKFIIIACGIGLLRYHFRHDSLPFQIFIFASLAASSIVIPSLLHLLPPSSISVSLLWALSLLLITLNESAIFLLHQDTFVKLRPNLMLIVMKSISYFYESQNSPSSKTAKSLLLDFSRSYIEFLSYLLHPSSLILGVWHPHQTWKSRPDSTWIHLPNGLLRCLLSSALCLLFLLISSCFIDYYIVGLAFEYLFDLLESLIPWSVVSPLQVLLLAYSTAVQFHFSHYFICFAAQSMFDLWDIRLTITKPVSIELPRSLVDVVIAWNIPMHHWLKRYVFQPFKRYCGNNVYATIFFTYFISSYLHGFNFQIWTVLLTLGLLTQAEYKLRHRLATIFSACIESRPCEYISYAEEVEDERTTTTTSMKCSKANHQNTGHGWFTWVLLTNAGFTLLALVNLAFLGSTFDGKPDSSNLANVWFIWAGQYFYSHIIALVMFLLYKFI